MCVVSPAVYIAASGVSELPRAQLDPRCRVREPMACDITAGKMGHKRVWHHQMGMVEGWRGPAWIS